jgi:hypothetical protein
MATFDDLFNRNTTFIQWKAEGETLVFVVDGEPNAAAPQKDFKTGLKKFMVETEEPNPAKPGKNKYKVMTEDQFDPAELEKKELNFWALTQIEIPVRVVARKNAQGEALPHTEFKANWELSENQKDRFKDALMEDKSIKIEKGTIIGVKCIDFSAKPRKYAIKLKAGE